VSAAIDRTFRYQHSSELLLSPLHVDRLNEGGIGWRPRDISTDSGCRRLGDKIFVGLPRTRELGMFASRFGDGFDKEGDRFDTRVFHSYRPCVVRRACACRSKRRLPKKCISIWLPLVLSARLAGWLRAYTKWRNEDIRKRPAGPIDVAATRLRPQKRALDDVLSARDPARLAPATIPPLQSSCTYAGEFACRIFRGDGSRITGRHNASA